MEEEQVQRKISATDLHELQSTKQKSNPSSIKKSFSLSSRPRCRTVSAWVGGRPRNSTVWHPGRS
jgi:hypothetical protein